MPAAARPTLKITRVLIKKLKQDPGNVREHSARNLAAITASLERFGQQKPIVVDKGWIVRAGNGTLAGAIELGWTHLDIIKTKLTGDEAKAYAIADNRTSELASWEDSLGLELQTLVGNGIDIGAMGFDEVDLNALVNGWDKPPANVNDVGDYKEDDETFVIKITMVPSKDKDVVLEVINAALKEAEHNYEAKAY